MLKKVIFMLLMASSTLAIAGEKKRVLEFDETVIQGEIKRPEAYFIMQRAIFELNETEQTHDFRKQIIDVVETELFD